MTTTRRGGRSRREWLVGAAALGGLGLMPRAQAGPPPTEDPRLAARLELWSGYARKSRNLVARIISTRTSSLLFEPLVVSGALAFLEPDTLALRDDDVTGSATVIRHGISTITSNRPDASSDPLAARPSLSWLSDRLVALFAPGDGSRLIADSVARVPKGRKRRLELLPPEGSPARQEIRMITVELDSVGGHILQITIDEARGDQLKLGLSDHRQNVDEDQVRRILEGG